MPVNTRPRFPLRETVAENTRARVERIRAGEEEAKRGEARRAEAAEEAFVKAGDQAMEKRKARALAKAEKQRAKEGGGVEGSLFGDEGETAAVPTLKPKSTAAIARPSTVDSSEVTSRPAGYFHEVPSHPTGIAFGPPITTLPHDLFPFPSTPRDFALVATFTALLSRGLRIGLGPRFGGEYLVYPGDYLRYHAHFTSQVIVRDECIKPGEIVAWGRLGTGTKKAGLLCCWDDGVRTGEGESEGEGEDVEGQVEFYSLEWANFG